MKKIILILVVIALVVFFVTRNNSDEVVMDEVSMDETSQEVLDTNFQEGENMDQVVMDESQNNLVISGGYESYDAGKLAFANEGTVVVFFRASWCPSCKALDENIKANMNIIPENLLILDVNYDTENQMKQKYGVTTQHTLVQVDAEGNLIQKWSGGSTLESIVEKI